MNSFTILIGDKYCMHLNVGSHLWLSSDDKVQVDELIRHTEDGGCIFRSGEDLYHFYFNECNAMRVEKLSTAATRQNQCR